VQAVFSRSCVSHPKLFRFISDIFGIEFCSGESCFSSCHFIITFHLPEAEAEPFFVSQTTDFTEVT
jgi:hypothetical protein